MLEYLSSRTKSATNLLCDRHLSGLCPPLLEEGVGCVPFRSIFLWFIKKHKRFIRCLACARHCPKPFVGFVSHEILTTAL